MRISFAIEKQPKSGAIVVGVADGGKLPPAATELDKAAGGALAYFGSLAQITLKYSAVCIVVRFHFAAGAGHGHTRYRTASACVAAGKAIAGGKVYCVMAVAS